MLQVKQNDIVVGSLFKDKRMADIQSGRNKRWQMDSAHYM